MARKPATSRATTPKRLNAASLASLGPEALSELLMEAADADALLKRRLRLALAAQAGPEALGLELDKRLTSVATSKAKVSWRKRPDLLRELAIFRTAILDQLAPASAVAGLERLIEWFDLFRGLSNRVKDPRGELADLFETASPYLWELGERIQNSSDPAVVEAGLQRLADAIRNRPMEYARWLGAGGEALQKDLAIELIARLDPASTERGARTALRRLADRADDLDLWLALATPQEKGSPDFAAAMAQRLLAAGRTDEAQAALEAALEPSAANRRWTFGRSPSASPPTLTPAWEIAAIDLSDARGDRQEAQSLRWAMFERDLSAPVLRAYLSRLDDFDDVEAQDRAFAHAANHPDFEKALGLLMDWPAHREAAALIAARPHDLRAHLPQRLDWAARLAQRYPAAADALMGRG